MAGRTQLPCLWPSWRHGLDPKVTWSAVEAAWHNFWKHHKLYKLYKLYKLVLISKFVLFALFPIEGDAPVTTSDFSRIFHIHDPRYGIMMKRQEFREKAEEIGFVKYRWGTQVSSRSEHSSHVKMRLVIGTPTTDRRVCSWCRCKRWDCTDCAKCYQDEEFVWVQFLRAFSNVLVILMHWLYLGGATWTQLE